jgi:hypothetical protein
MHCSKKHPNRSPRRRALGPAAAEIRCARKLFCGPLFGRHRLPDDDAQGRPCWDDLSHRKSGAL